MWRSLPPWKRAHPLCQVLGGFFSLDWQVLFYLPLPLVGVGAVAAAQWDRLLPSPVRRFAHRPQIYIRRLTVRSIP
jgi:hypothetical protein